MALQRSSTKLEPMVVLVFAGAVLAALGAVLPWAKITVSGLAASPKGIDGWEGKTILILCAGMVVRTLMHRGGRRNLAPFVVIGGVVIAGIALYDVLTLSTQVVNDVAPKVAGQVGGSIDLAKAAIRHALDVGDITVAPQLGIYLSIVGGLTGAAGGVAGMLGRRREASEATTATPATALSSPDDGRAPWIAGPVGEPQPSQAPQSAPAPPAAVQAAPENFGF